MRHRQHQARRDQAAGAEIAARADDGDDGAGDRHRRAGAAPPTMAWAGGGGQQRGSDDGRQDSSSASAIAARRSPPSSKRAGADRVQRASRFRSDIAWLEGSNDRGGDLGFRRGADHLAVRGVCAVRDASAAFPPTSSAAPMPPIIWKTPGRNSSAPRSISRPSINCSRQNRARSARRSAARTCCRCCRAICGPRWSRRSSAIKAQCKTGCITNNLPANAIGSTSGRSLYVAEVMALFDHVIESAKIGLRKPDPRIYRMMVEALKVDPRRNASISTISAST